MGLISTLKQLEQNINTVEKYLAFGKEEEKMEMNNLIKRGTCFVAYSIGDELRFAPSRFLGYVHNELYKHANSAKDGRETNKSISKILDAEPTINAALEKKYFVYCNTLGVQPNNNGAFGAPRKFWTLKFKQEFEYRNQPSSSTSYYIIGSKYGQQNDVDMLPLMEAYNVVCTGFAWDYDLINLYQKSEIEIMDFLKEKKEEPKSYNAIRKFLQLKPGDIVAVKSDGSPKAGKPFLEIVAYAVVVERDGEVYWHDQERFGHCINVQFIKTGFKKQLDLGGYGRTIHRIMDIEVINTLFDHYKTANSTNVRQKIIKRRRTRSAVTSKNILLQNRKGSIGYVTNPVHNQIQQHFKFNLEKQFGKENVQLEENNVDLKLFQQNLITFYEVKPYDFAEDCIRSGLGQLLSYVFFDRDKRKKKIRIVGPYPPNDEEQGLITFLKQTLSIDFYESFNID